MKEVSSFMKLGQLALVPIGLLTAGCTVLTSASISDIGPKDAATGVHYCLPKSIMEFRLSANPETVQFKVTAGAPRFIRDSSHCYYMNYQPLPQYDDHIKVELGPHGYLKLVSADTTDRSVDIIKNLARAFGAFGYGLESAYLGTSDESVTSDTIDPTDKTELEDMGRAFNKQMKAYAASKVKSVCGAADKAEGKGVPVEPGKAAGPKIPNVTNRIRCEEFKRYVEMTDPLLLGFERFHPVKKEKGYHASCKVGLCYRVPEAWELKVEIGTAGSEKNPGKGISESDVRESAQRSLHLLPNKSRLVEIDLERAFLVNKAQTITFTDDGLLDSVSVRKGSELLALSSIPIEVVSAIAEGLKIRVGVLDQQIGNTKASTELIEARAALEKQRAQLEGGLAVADKGQGAVTASRVPVAGTAAPLAREEAIP